MIGLFVVFVLVVGWFGVFWASLLTVVCLVVVMVLLTVLGLVIVVVLLPVFALWLVVMCLIIFVFMFVFVLLVAVMAVIAVVAVMTFGLVVFGVFSFLCLSRHALCGSLLCLGFLGFDALN